MAKTSAVDPPSIHTLAELVFHVRDLSAGRPDLLTLRRGSRRETLSTTDFVHGVHSLALAFEARGLERGDRVALFSEGRPEWHQIDLACQVLGLVSVPIDPGSTPERVGFVLRNSGSRWVVYSDTAKHELLKDLQPTLPRPVMLVAIDPEASGVDPGEADLGDEPELQLDLTQLLGEGAARRGSVPLERYRGRVEEDDLATLLYTSGTTGDPKGVMLSQRNLVSSFLACDKAFPLGVEDLAVSFLPLSHGLQRTLDHLCLYRGVAIHHVPDAADMSTALRETRPTLLVALAQIYERAHERTLELLDDECWLRRRFFASAIRIGGRYRTALRSGFVGPLLAAERWLAELLVFRWVRRRFGGRLRFALCGGGPLKPETAELFAAVGLPVDQGYGLAESSPVLAATAPRQRKEGSVGKALDEVELRLAEDGEILARGPGVMLGYWEAPEATAESIDDSGWLRTGDVGHFDKSGYLFVTDRKQDLITTSDGRQVAPRPIEQRLKGDGIARAIVVGEGRPYLVALLVPDFAALRRDLPEPLGDREDLTEASPVAPGKQSLTEEALARHPTVRQRLEQRVAEVNQQTEEGERIERFAVLERDFSQEQGELTTGLKLRRRTIVQAWADRIAELYRREDPGT